MKKISIFLIIYLISVVFASIDAKADIPHLIRYQRYITDNQNTSLDSFALVNG